MTASREASVRHSGLWASVLALLFTGLLVWVALNHGRPLGWDRTLHAAALQHRTPWLIAAAKPVSVGIEVVAYTVSAVGGVLLLRSRSWWRGALVGVGILIVGQVLRVGLAALIARARPPRADWAATAAGFSFPSGHTVSATLAAGLLCLGLLRTVHSAWRVAGFAVALCWAILDGVSRVYQGVHWPSDVLAGWLFGSALILLVDAVLDGERLGSWTTSGRRRSSPPIVRQEGAPPASLPPA
jgi:membrane-associated phospholipid phosphatase